MPLRALFLSLLVWLACLPAAQAETLLIAGGAGYKRPISEIATAFEAKHSIRVEQIYGHMGHVLTQTKQTGQVAVVFGDLSFLEKPAGVAFTRFVPVGKGRLVVAWPQNGRMTQPAELADSRFARIAIADAKSAIYGIAATEFLHNSGLAERIGARLQTIPTVPQVSAYLISGEIDAGFVNLTEALAIRERIGGFIEIDGSLHAPIRIVGGIVRGFEAQPAVRDFAAFLESSPEVRAILTRHGL